MEDIHVVAPAYPPDVSGMARGADGITRLLRAIGYKVRVYTLSPTQEGYRIRAWPRTKYAGFSWKSFSADSSIVIYHIPCIGVIEISFFVHALRMCTGKEKQNIIVYYHMRAGGAGRLALVARWYERLITPCMLLLARQVWVSTDDYLAYTHPWIYKQLCKKKNLFTIPFPLEDKVCHVQAKTEKPSFAFVGGLDREHYFKGVSLLIRAMRNVDAHLTVVGEGDLRVEYEQLVRNLGLVSRVSFVGRVSDVVRDRIVAQSWALILPSVNTSEAFGIVLVEAMRVGTPVIASNLPGVRSVVAPPAAGWVFDTGSEERLVEVMQMCAAQRREDVQRRSKSAREHFLSCFRIDVIKQRIDDALQCL